MMYGKDSRGSEVAMFTARRVEFGGVLEVLGNLYIQESSSTSREIND